MKDVQTSTTDFMKDKTLVISGATRGIGKAICIDLLKMV